MKKRLVNASIASVVVALGASLIVGNASLWQSRTASAQAAAKNDAEPLSAEGMKAFRTLEKAGYFATGGVGIANVASKSERALRVLLKEKKGAVALRGLFKTASPAGKLYALLGLRQIGTPRAVTEVADSLRSDKTVVPILRGCIGSSGVLGPLATQIETGAIALPPEQTASQVKSQNKPTQKPPEK